MIPRYVLGGILAAVFAESVYQRKKCNGSVLGDNMSKDICLGDNYVCIRSQALRNKSYITVDCSAKRVVSVIGAQHCNSDKGRKCYAKPNAFSLPK